MLYPIFIEQGDNKHAYGVVVPDIKGCFSAGDTLEEAYENTKEAIVAHLELLADMGEEIPTPKTLEKHRANKEYQNFILSVVEVDISHLLGKSEKINITLPSRLIRYIDEFVARNPDYKNRSNFLAKVASDRVFSHHTV